LEKLEGLNADWPSGTLAMQGLEGHLHQRIHASVCLNLSARSSESGAIAFLKGQEGPLQGLVQTAQTLQAGVLTKFSKRHLSMCGSVQARCIGSLVADGSTTLSLMIQTIGRSGGYLVNRI
jgi:hypothetical protein